MIKVQLKKVEFLHKNVEILLQKHGRLIFYIENDSSFPILSYLHNFIAANILPAKELLLIKIPAIIIVVRISNA